MNKSIFLISLILIPFFLKGQEINYLIKAEIDSEENIISINEIFK